MNHAKKDSLSHELAEKIIIRRGNAGDIEECTRLVAALFSLETEFSFDPAPVRKALGMLLESDEACLMVADYGGKAIGMATGQMVISTACGAPSVWVEDVVVQEDYRGIGLGKRIMTGIEDWARSKTGARCQLLADSLNQPALDFYAKLGYLPSRMVPYRKIL